MAEHPCDYCDGTEPHPPCPVRCWDLARSEAINEGYALGGEFQAPCGCGLVRTPIGGWIYMKCLSRALDLGHDRP